MKFWRGLASFQTVVSKTWHNTNEDRIWGRAAELAYYFLFALFPMLIFVVSLVGFLPGVREGIFKDLATIVPGEAMNLISQTIDDVVRNRHGSLISFGILGALWAASGGVTAVMDSLNIAYDVKEERSIWKTRLLALGLTILLSFLIVGGTVLVMFGDRFSAHLVAQFGLGKAFVVLWGIVDYGVGLAELFLALQLIYYFGPNIKQAWKWVTPGAIFAVLSLLAASLLFSLYLRVAPNYSATYGSLGAVVVLMLWFYLAGAVILIGGELNSVVLQLTGTPVIQKEKVADQAAPGPGREQKHARAGTKTSPPQKQERQFGIESELTPLPAAEK